MYTFTFLAGWKIFKKDKKKKIFQWADTNISFTEFPACL